MIKKVKKYKNKLEENKLYRILYSIFKTIAYVLIVSILLVIVVQRVSKNNLSIGGVRIFTVVSGSMIGEYDIGDILISKHVSCDKIEVGDNVTYYGTSSSVNGLIITHKVVNKDVRDGKTYFITQGIANTIADPEISCEQVYGKVIYRTRLLSFLGKLMTNIIAYYLIFVIVALMISYEIVSMIFSKEEDEDIEDGEE